MSAAQPLHHLRWEGAGPTVVLLHGVGGGRNAWADEVSGTGLALAQAGFHVVAPDLPGYGLSAPHEALSIESMARSVLDLMHHVEPNRPCIVVGHSMGGMVAQAVHALAPSRLVALVIWASSPAFGKPDGDWQRQFVRDRLQRLDDGQSMRDLAPTLVRAMCAPNTPPERLKLASELMAAVPETTYRQAVKALVGFDLRAQLPNIRVPVLCLAGELDPNAPPTVLQAMASRIPGAECCVMPGVGHLANIEAPEVFNPTLVDFLSKLHHEPN
jgi:3-oxoadipate enol-lactonase